MRFTEEVRAASAALWHRVFAHPFVRAIGDATLPREKFRFYIGQDYVYLQEYVRARALAVAKAPDERSMRKTAEALNTLLNSEMLLHRRLAPILGVTTDELAQSPMAPTNHAYTRHLLAVAYSGTFAEYLAAIWPCAHSYQEIGIFLAERGMPHETAYAEWIHFYSGPAYGAMIGWVGELLDAQAKLADPLTHAKMVSHYQYSARYEYMFWEMAWHQERWPL